MGVRGVQVFDSVINSKAVNLFYNYYYVRDTWEVRIANCFSSPAYPHGKNDPKYKCL